MKTAVKICIVCGTEFTKPKFGCSVENWKKRKFCSLPCFYSGPTKHRFPVGHRSWMTGTKGIRQSPSTEFKKGHVRPQAWIDAHKLKTSGENNSSKRPEVREKMRLLKSGSKSPFWKGGISKENYRLRRTAKYAQWRTAVFARDDYTCRACRKRGGKLHAHHIKSFESYPELRFEVSNGDTLCIPCHKQTDSYAKNLK